MSDERRRETRLRILGHLPGDVTIVEPVRIIDISPRGAAVEIDRELALESLHDFRLSLGDRSVVVKVRVAYCRVSDIWQNRTTYRTGVEFVDVSPHARDAISEYITGGSPTRAR